MMYDTSQGSCIQFTIFCVSLFSVIDRFVPYYSGAYHWQWQPHEDPSTGETILKNTDEWGTERWYKDSQTEHSRVQTLSDAPYHILLEHYYLRDTLQRCVILEVVIDTALCTSVSIVWKYNQSFAVCEIFIVHCKATVLVYIILIQNIWYSQKLIYHSPDIKIFGMYYEVNVLFCIILFKTCD